jgi:RNA polymerase sigma factor (sigma-70 family)
LKKEDTLLLEYKRTGDIRLLGELYAPYMPLVYGVCLKYYQNAAKSEDAVMAIFEELISKLQVHQVINFRSWLHSVARNYCLMDLRRQKNMELVNIEDFGGDVPDKSSILDGYFDAELEGNLQLLETCLQSLSPEQQKCIRLFYLEKKCYADIVNITGYEPSKVKSHIQNGKRNLKLCMEKMGYGK